MSHAQELTADRDRSSLFYVARALHGLQQRWGTIPHVKGKGDAAAAVQRILARMRQEQGQEAPPAGGGVGWRCAQLVGCQVRRPCTPGLQAPGRALLHCCCCCPQRRQLPRLPALTSQQTLKASTHSFF